MPICKPFGLKTKGDLKPVTHEYLLDIDRKLLVSECAGRDTSQPRVVILHNLLEMNALKKPLAIGNGRIVGVFGQGHISGKLGDQAGELLNLSHRSFHLISRGSVAIEV